MKNLAELINKLEDRKKEYDNLTEEEIEIRKEAFIEDDNLQRQGFEYILQIFSDTITELEENGEIEEGSVLLTARRKSFDSTVRNEQTVRRKNRGLLRTAIADLEMIQETMLAGEYVGNLEEEILKIMGTLSEVNKGADDSWGIKIVSSSKSDTDNIKTKDTTNLRKVRKWFSQKVPIRVIKQTKHADSTKSDPDYDGLHQVMYIPGEDILPMFELQSRSGHTDYECTYGKLSHPKYVAKKEGGEVDDRIKQMEDIIRNGQEELPINLPRMHTRVGKQVLEDEIDDIIKENFGISKERILQLRKENMLNIVKSDDLEPGI